MRSQARTLSFDEMNPSDTTSGAKRVLKTPWGKMRIYDVNLAGIRCLSHLLLSCRRRSRYLLLGGSLIGLALAACSPTQKKHDIGTNADNNKFTSNIKILDDENASTKAYLPDFSYAGYNNGIGETPKNNDTIIDVATFGAKADDNEDDSEAILKAILVAQNTAGTVTIKFPPGRFQISQIIPIGRSYISLKGTNNSASKRKTELYFPLPLSEADKTNRLDKLRGYLKKNDKRVNDKKSNTNPLFSEYSWTGGFIWVEEKKINSRNKNKKTNIYSQALRGKRGSKYITASSAERSHVGQVVSLQWFNKKGKRGPLIQELYGTTDINIGSRHWENPQRALIQQKTRIIDIDKNVVTISDPLLHNISETLPAQFASWRHLSHIGIENLDLIFPETEDVTHHLERGYNGIYLRGVFDSWIKNVTIKNADSEILTSNGANVTIKNIETLGRHRAHYSVHAGSMHNMLVQNLKVKNPVVHSISVNTKATKCVFSNVEIFIDPILDQHAGANHQNLFDNITVHLKAKQSKKGYYYPLWNGSGAKYWQPGHGRFNTTWNTTILTNSSIAPQQITLQGLEEGAEARIIGIHGKDKFSLDYRPRPYSERLNHDMTDIPSLYNWQLQRRLRSTSLDSL